MSWWWAILPSVIILEFLIYYLYPIISDWVHLQTQLDTDFEHSIINALNYSCDENDGHCCRWKRCQVFPGLMCEISEVWADIKLNKLQKIIIIKLRTLRKGGLWYVQRLNKILISYYYVWFEVRVPMVGAVMICPTVVWRHQMGSNSILTSSKVNWFSGQDINVEVWHFPYTATSEIITYLYNLSMVNNQ